MTCWLRAQAVDIPTDGSVADAYIEYNPGPPDSGHTTVYLSCTVWFSQAAANVWIADASNGSNSGSPSFMTWGGRPGFIYARTTGTSLVWRVFDVNSSSFPVGSADLSPATPETCHQIQIKLVQNQFPEIIINGELFAMSGYTPLSSGVSAPRLGLEFDYSDQTNDDPDQVVFITGFKYGTTSWGSTDIYSDDFSSTPDPADPPWYGAFSPYLITTCSGPSCLNPRVAFNEVLFRSAS